MKQPFLGQLLLCFSLLIAGFGLAQAALPTIIPSGIKTAAATGTLTIVDLGTPAVTADTPNPTVTNNAPKNGAGQAVFPVGTTIVIWTVTDAEEHTVKALQRVTVFSGGTLASWGPAEGYLIPLPAGNNYVAVDVNMYHGLALRADGSLVAWGYNSVDDQCTVPSGNNYVAIAAGMHHSLALKADGSLMAWGSNTDGQCTVPSGSDFVDISAGSDHSLALKADGSLAAWGKNDYQQCAVSTEKAFQAISAGYFHSMALKMDGSLAAWGRNSEHQSDVPEGNDYKGVNADLYNSLALKTDGSIVFWGGSGIPPAPPAGNDYIAAHAGFYYTIGLHADGTLAAAGNEINNLLAVPAGRYTTLSAYYNGTAVAIRAPEYQPDMQIKGSDDADFKGAHVYNDDAAQTTTSTTADTAVYHLLVGNDSGAMDIIKLTAPVTPDGWTIHYIDEREGGGDFTAAVTNPAGWAPAVAPGTTVPCRIEVTPAAAVNGNQSLTITISAQSTNNPAKGDAVIVTTTKQPLQRVTLAGSQPSPVVENTPLTFTAATVGGGTPEYKFRVGKLTANGTVWDPLPPAYTANPAFEWHADTGCAGTYYIRVYAREQGTTTYVTTTLTCVVKPALSALTLAVSPASPQPWTQPLTLTATPTGGARLEYQFKATYTADDGSTQRLILCEYQASPTWTGQLPQGVARSYMLYAYAREQGTAVSYLKMSGARNFTTAPPLAAVSLTVSPTSPQPWNQKLTLTATPTGGGKLEYQFKATYTADDGSTQLLVLREYQASPTWTGQLPQGVARSYRLYAYAREQGMIVAYQKMSGAKTFTTVAPLSALTLTVSPASPQSWTQPVTLTAVPTGGNKLEYQFKATYTADDGTLVRLVLCEYQPSPIWTGSLPQDAARTYTLYACAREQGTTVSYLKISAGKSFVTRAP